VRDQRIEDLEQFLARRGQALLRTAVLLPGSIEAGEDLLQTAIERLLGRGRRLDGDPEGSWGLIRDNAHLTCRPLALPAGG
jgi:DNA-directed RNA polymerase specialized sigma24 family protein